MSAPGLAMTDRLPLEQLLAQGRPAAHPVALTPDGPRDFRDFMLAVSAWAETFRTTTAQRIALYCEDSFEFASALFAAWHSGKCVFLPGDGLPGTLTALAAQVDAFAGDLPKALKPAPATAGTDAPMTWSALNPDAEQLVIFTSGSTGTPEAIGKRLGQLFREAGNLARCFNHALPASAIVLATVSHQHIYGLLFRILWPLASGHAFASTRLAYPEDMLAAMRSCPAVLVASPAHLKRLPAHLPWSEARPFMLFSSGGPLPLEALHACRTLLGQAPREIFGSSETGGIAWRQRHADDNACWQPLPGVTLEVRDGLLHVSSEHAPDRTWLDARTRARHTPAGIVLEGRTDQIVKIEEKRVSLTAVEALLLATGLVHEVGLVMLERPRTGLGVVIVLSPAGRELLSRQGRQVVKAQLREALAGHLDPVSLPRRWRHVEQLPVNAQGKVTQAALNACFQETFAPPEAVLLQRADGEARLSLMVPAGSDHFAGHFPGQPVLPGVTQLDWAIHYGRRLFDLPAAFMRLEQVKFQQLITPDLPLTLILGHDPARQLLTFRFVSEHGAHASGRIVFGDA